MRVCEFAKGQSSLVCTIIHVSGASLLKCIKWSTLTLKILMAGPLDIELLRDLRNLGKPSTFDGTDAENQDFRFSFHMSFVSPVSQQLLDRRWIEKIPISLQAVEALGVDNANCHTQIRWSLALITKSSVQTLDRSVEETNGAEGWRLLDIRFAPGTQNRQSGTRESLERTPKRYRTRLESLGTGRRRMGTCFRNLCRRRSKVRKGEVARKERRESAGRCSDEQSL